MDVFRWGAFGLLVFGWLTAAGGELERAARWLQPPSPSGEFVIRMHFLNPTEAPVSLAVPRELSWEFTPVAGGPSRRGEMTVLEDVPSTLRALAPGAFRSADFRGTLGAGYGPGTLTLTGVGAVLPVVGPADTLAGASGGAGVPDRTGAEPAPGASGPGVGSEPALPPAPPAPPPPVQTALGDFFLKHFRGHEPLYFVWGPDTPNVKFQISLRYRLIDPDADLRPAWEWSYGLNLAYTQVSLWDWDTPSAPFFDSSYKPELMWTLDDFRPAWHDREGFWKRLSGRVGVLHESNGQAGDESRALNMFYVRPSFTLGSVTNLFLEISPRAWAYLGELTENPDLPDYRGYADLSLRAGWADSLQLAGLFRVGDSLDRGSMQLDLSYPTVRLLGDLDLFLHVQYFNGWGESLLEYDQRTWSIRFGVSLYR